MADVLLIRRLRRRQINLINSLIIKFRGNPFDLYDHIFISKFRMSKRTVQKLCILLNPVLHRNTRGYSTEMQIFITLRLLATGSFQTVIADDMFHLTSQATISRTLERVIDGLISICPNIKFPTNASEITLLKSKFFLLGSFPNIIGVIDGTHILIKRPACPDWFSFLNRKNTFSINVQVVCDADMRIINLVAKWPGGTHDAYIWNQSELRNLFASGLIPNNTFLLGDSGYPLEPWLMTPYLRPQSQHQIVFNERLRITRSIVERTIGLLKNKFRCLDNSGGILLYNPEKTCKIIMACAILHNFCIDENVDDPQMVNNNANMNDDDDDDTSPNNPGMRSHSEQIRDQIALNFIR